MHSAQHNVTVVTCLLYFIVQCCLVPECTLLPTAAVTMHATWIDFTLLDRQTDRQTDNI